MTRTHHKPVGFIALLAATCLPSATALDPNFCADFNIATTARWYDDLQTNGLCHDYCFDKTAFAITQKNSCWCTNYAPAESIQVDMSKCNEPCPAYPPESCGGDGVFGYLRLNNNIKPSGTRGAGSDETSSTSKPAKTSSEKTKTTSEKTTKTSEPAPETTSSKKTSSTKKSSSSKSSSEAETTEPSTSSSSEEPTTSQIRTVTKDGVVTTVYLAPTSNPADAKGASDTSVPDKNEGGGGGDGLSTGALAGIIVGVIVPVIAIAAALVWFFLRRRKTQEEQGDYREDPDIRGSSPGMMGSATRTEMSQSGESPGSLNASSNRNSALLIDPRMDPFKQGLYMRSHSHESINTLRDEHDYSRPIHPARTLRATNPDPDTQD